MTQHQATPLRRTLLVALGLAGVFIIVTTIPTIRHRPDTPTPPRQQENATDLSTASKKDIALQLVAAAENSTLNWHSQYSYIEYNVEGNEEENRGYTGGIVGFTSRTGDMLELITYYSKIAPGNLLEKYIPALETVNGTSTTAGLGKAFENDWRAAAQSADSTFVTAQNYERDRVYFTPAVTLAKKDGLRALGQFMYYDAAVVHGPEGLATIRAATIRNARTPAEGGNEIDYLNHFLDIRAVEMRKERSHQNTSRLDDIQRVLLKTHNLALNTPFTISVYGDSYTVK